MIWSDECQFLDTLNKNFRTYLNICQHDIYEWIKPEGNWMDSRAQFNPTTCSSSLSIPTYWKHSETRGILLPSRINLEHHWNQILILETGEKASREIRVQRKELPDYTPCSSETFTVLLKWLGINRFVTYSMCTTILCDASTTLYWKKV